MLLRSLEFCLNETRDVVFLTQTWNNGFCLLSSMVVMGNGKKPEQETSQASMPSVWPLVGVSQKPLEQPEGPPHRIPLHFRTTVGAGGAWGEGVSQLRV